MLDDKLSRPGTDKGSFKFLNNKVVVINGASSEIGNAVCRILLDNGAVVGGTYNSRRDPVKMLTEDYGDDRVLMFKVDFLSENWQPAIGQIVEDTKKRWGRIDSLINASGVWLVKPFLYENEDDAKLLWRVNYQAPYLFIQKTIPHMLSTGGHIINVSSTAAMRGVGQEATYSASKAALVSLTESLAEEFAPRGIQINSISPTYTSTGALDKYTDESSRQLLVKHVPIGRLCEPTDVAKLVMGILMNDYLTGTNIPLHGGRL